MGTQNVRRISRKTFQKTTEFTEVSLDKSITTKTSNKTVDRLTLILEKSWAANVTGDGFSTNFKSPKSSGEIKCN